MRGNRVVLVLVTAVLLGLAASFMVWRYMNQPGTLQATEKPEGAQVVAAAVDIPVGTLITGEKLKLVSIDGANLPPGHFLDRRKVVGRGIVMPVVVNEPILESKLAPQGAGAGLPTVIPDGMRGVSVKVDEVIGVAGFVLPGTTVDVLVTVNDRQGEAELSLTKLVLQNVRVLAAGESIQKDSEGKPQKVTVITLLVTPEDAEKLTLASTEGRIQLALRNVLDQDSVRTDGSDMRTLVRGTRAEPPPAPVAVKARPARTVAPRATTNVEMYRGVEKQVETF